MSDDFIQALHPAHSPEAVHAYTTNTPRPHAREGLVIQGHIVSVTPGHPHPGEHHQLDVSVGGGEYTEILIRVPNGAYGHLTGRDVSLHLHSE